MKIHHLDIFNKFLVKNNIVFVLPELNNEFNFLDSKDYPLNKIVDSNYHDDIIYASDLIIKDKTFIDDVKNSDLYLIFTVAPKEYFLKNPVNYSEMWDSELHVKDLFFLGWTINSGTDTAIEDGIFPISKTYNEFQSIDVHINDLDAINRWGLIKNKYYLSKYIKKNKNEVRHIFSDSNAKKIDLKINWLPIAIYCDYYTYLKLCDRYI